MADTQADSKLLFQAGVAPDGKLVWSSVLSPADLHILLGRVMLELVTGQVKQRGEPAILPAGKEVLDGLNGLRKRMGLGS